MGGFREETEMPPPLLALAEQIYTLTSVFNNGFLYYAICPVIVKIIISMLYSNSNTTHPHTISKTILGYGGKKLYILKLSN